MIVIFLIFFSVFVKTEYFFSRPNFLLPHESLGTIFFSAILPPFFLSYSLASVANYAIHYILKL